MFADDLKSLLYESPPSLFIQDVGPKILQELKDISNTRLYYDGCNAGIRVGSGGKLRFYRNKYCNLRQAPPPLPDPEKEEHARVFCANGNEIYSVLAQSINMPIYNEIGQVSHYQFIEAGTFTQVRSDIEKQNAINRLEPVRRGLIASNANNNNNLYRNIQIVKRKTGWRIQNWTNIILAIYTKTPSGRITGVLNGQGITLLQQFVNLTLEAEEKVFGSDTWRFVTGGSYGWLVTQFQSPPCTLPGPLNPPPPPDIAPMDCCEDLRQLLQLTLKRIGEPQKVAIFDEDLERKGTQKADKIPQTLNDYLKLAVERTEIVNRLIGIENFPVTVPDTMITPFQEGVFAKVFKFIDAKKKRKIGSLTEFIAWMSEQDSAVLGEFHQVIQFQTEDNKTSSVVLPNVAEALKEIVLLTSQMARQNNTQTELIFKIAAETVATRAAASKSTAIIQDIQDYLDYPTQTKTSTIPTAISLPKLTINKAGVPIATAKTEDYKNFLKPGEIKFVYDDWTGDNSLHDQVLDLLQLAAMLRAIYFQRTDK